MVSGKYTYLTYMLMSTTCFFFWLTPNCHKFRGMFSAKSPSTFSTASRSSQKNSGRQSNYAGRTHVVTRNQAKRGTKDNEQ